MFIVIIKVLKGILTIESRGKRGIINYFVKLFLRYAGKLSFVRRKKEAYLEQESTKNAEETLSKKEIKIIYDKLPEKGLPKD